MTYNDEINLEITLAYVLHSDPEALLPLEHCLFGNNVWHCVRSKASLEEMMGSRNLAVATGWTLSVGMGKDCRLQFLLGHYDVCDLGGGAENKKNPHPATNVQL